MVGADVLAERLNSYERRVQHLEIAQEAMNKKLGEIETTLLRIKWIGYGMLTALGVQASGATPWLRAWIGVP